MPRFETFDRDIAVATADLSEEAISAELARVARAELAGAISRGEGSPVYERFVNGRAGAAEESVRAPGPILYQFSWWPEIVEFALEFLRKRSPVRSGRFQSSWAVMAGTTPVSDFDAIPVEGTVTVVNVQPYARKIEVGHMRMSVPPGVAEAAKVAVQRQYGAILTVRKTIMTIPGGYVLRGRFRRDVGQFARSRIRRDTAAGAAMTYPALVMSLKA